MTSKDDGVPKVGDLIYVGSAFHLSHGRDDRIGGLASVIKVKDGISGGRPTVYVTVDAFPEIEFNWQFLQSEQQKLKEDFGPAMAYRDPDDRLEFNEP